METPLAYGADSQWMVGVLVVSAENASRLALEGTDGVTELHCGQTIELEIAPNMWLRGRVELNSRHWIHITCPDRGHDQKLPGWYLHTGSATNILLLIPGMTVRLFRGTSWPEPEYPYEGQCWRSAWGRCALYRDGRWVTDAEQ